MPVEPQGGEAAWRWEALTILFLSIIICCSGAVEPQGAEVRHPGGGWR